MKRLVLVAENTRAALLETELEQYRDDAEAEGWYVHEVACTESDNPFDIQAQVRMALNDAVRTDEQAVCLVGPVPVPRSYIDSRPDGHRDAPDLNGCVPADWFYGSAAPIDTGGLSWATKTVAGERVLSNYFAPSVYAAVGRIDFSGVKRLAGGIENDREWELARYQEYFARLHAGRSTPQTPLTGLAAHSPTRKAWAMGCLQEIMGTETAAPASTASNLTAWVPGGTVPNNPYRACVITPQTLKEYTHMIDAALLCMYQSFTWNHHSRRLDAKGRPLHWKAFDGPWMRHWLAKRPHALACIWGDRMPNAEVLRAGSAIGRAVLEIPNSRMVSQSIQGDPTVVLFPKE